MAEPVGGGAYRRRADLLAWPLLGRCLKWPHARAAMQLPLLVVAGFMLFDGFLGPQLAPKNLATVVTWLHYPGLTVLGLLVSGNLFCMACPFMLPRQAGSWLGRRLLGRGRNVPRFLRNKWLSIGLLFLFFYAFERFSLWDSPLLTAWLVLSYFVVAFLVNTWFRGAAFCKYVCPLGQLHFFGSLVSPLEIKVRRPQACRALPHQGLYPWRPRLRVVAVPGTQGRQHGLHFLP